MKEKVIELLMKIFGFALVAIMFLSLSAMDSENMLLPAIGAIVPLAIVAIGTNMYVIGEDD